MKGGDLTEFYIWTEVDDGGSEGALSTMIPALPQWGIIPLVTRNRDVAEGHFAEAAKMHHLVSGHRVRLRRVTQFETLRDLP